MRKIFLTGVTLVVIAVLSLAYFNQVTQQNMRFNAGDPVALRAGGAGIILWRNSLSTSYTVRVAPEKPSIAATEIHTYYDIELAPYLTTTTPPPPPPPQPKAPPIPAQVVPPPIPEPEASKK